MIKPFIEIEINTKTEARGLTLQHNYHNHDNVLNEAVWKAHQRVNSARSTIIRTIETCKDCKFCSISTLVRPRRPCVLVRVPPFAVDRFYAADGEWSQLQWTSHTIKRRSYTVTTRTQTRQQLDGSIDCHQRRVAEWTRLPEPRRNTKTIPYCQ